MWVLECPPDACRAPAQRHEFKLLDILHPNTVSTSHQNSSVTSQHLALDVVVRTAGDGFHRSEERTPQAAPSIGGPNIAVRFHTF